MYWKCKIIWIFRIYLIHCIYMDSLYYRKYTMLISVYLNTNNYYYKNLHIVKHICIVVVHIFERLITWTIKIYFNNLTANYAKFQRPREREWVFSSTCHAVAQIRCKMFESAFVSELLLTRNWVDKNDNKWVETTTTTANMVQDNSPSCILLFV